jgi:flagellar hook assembly protein FlgD
MSDIIPDKYSLEQNYPNPFNPNTTIEFTLPEDVENVRLTIYNALGEKVAELVNGKMEAGRYRYQWNAGNVATGLYIYELKTNKFSSVKKMMLLK